MSNAEQECLAPFDDPDDLATSKFNYSAYVKACGAEQCTFKKEEFSVGTFVSQVFSLQLR